MKPNPCVCWLLLFLVACAPAPGDTAVGTPTGTTPPQGPDTTVEVFDNAHVYFSGEDNYRDIDIHVELPDESATYSQVLGTFSLSCPEDGCDHWDRYGTFGIVDADGVYVEIDRFITAYRVGFEWTTDLTDLRPLLTGDTTLRVSIDTWVGPGHSDGAGWLFDADLSFVGGPAPSPEPIAVHPVWPHQSWSAGLDDSPVEAQVVPTTIDGPINSARLRTFITGHGWNNAINCAEFCAKTHTFTVDEESHDREVWRDDCDQTETDGTQLGTWEYARAGWCPGAQVHPWNIDLVLDDASTNLSYGVQDFVWSGNGDQPYYYVSALLIDYR